MVDASAPQDDEPKSPIWLPALGAAIFLGIGLWWDVMPSAQATGPQPGASQVMAQASAPPAPPGAPPAPGLAPSPPTGAAGQMMPPRPMPNPGAGGPNPRMPI